MLAGAMPLPGTVPGPTYLSTARKDIPMSGLGENFDVYSAI
jgi:hypothetical protein